MEVARAIELTRTLSKGEAWQIVGGLSRTTKMPCHSWGTPAKACKTGTALARQAGTVCSHCYALQGAYRWREVQQAYERRLRRADHPLWEPAKIYLVDWQSRKNETSHFRWFDSGDLRDASMLERINTVARGTPTIEHWLPTREYRLVRDYLRRRELAPNLTVRLSAHFIDAKPTSRFGLPTSTVHDATPPSGFECPSRTPKPSGCGDCRACWDPGVRNVSYDRH